MGALGIGGPDGGGPDGGDAEDRAGRPVPPGGWPDDPARPDTPVAGSAADVAVLAAGAVTLDELVARQSVCRACPRLVAWREEVAVVRRRSPFPAGGRRGPGC